MHETEQSGNVTRIIPGVVDVVVLARPTATATSNGPVSEGVVSWRVLTLKRGENTRCTGAWEIVHGRIESGERPEHAAVRELVEETGLSVQRLYSIAVNSFYLHQTGTVHMALVFAAVVDDSKPVMLGPEHSECAWRSFAEATEVLAWPREREALLHVQQLLKHGDAGPVEDVLRII